MLEEKLGEKVDVSGLRGVKYSTIGGESEPMPILIPDKILVAKKGKIEAVKAVVGVIDKDFKMYDGLLHSAVV